MTILLALLPDAGHDQQFLLLAAQRMGSHLNPYGPTVFESNPPLAIWLSAIPAALAHLLHWSPTAAFKLCVVLVAAGSAAVSVRLLRRLGRELTPERLWLLGIAFVLIFGAIPARDFGQRDHILALLILPYLIASAESAPMGILPRTLIALTAALGLALKPHEALIPVAVEVTLVILRVGSRRIRLLEPAIFLLAAFAYLGAIRLFAPTYLSEVLPVMRETYWAFGQLSLPALLWAAIELLLLAAITFVVFRKLRPSGPLVRILLAAGSAATLAYLIQGTGWYYQQLPAISLFSLALTLMILGGRSQKDPSFPSGRWARNPWPAATLTLLALTLTFCFSDFHLTPRGIEQSQSIPDPAFFADLAPGTSVATLTTSVDDTVPPASRYRLTLAQRYPHLWMLPAILRNESGPAPRHRIPPAKLADLDRLQHRFMVEDLTRWRPALILVERCQDPQVHCQVLEDRHDDLLAFFLRDPAFATIFAHYRFLRALGPYDAYALKPWNE